jgi:hypothetical protein
MAPFGRTVGIVFSWLVSTQLLLYPYTIISPAQTAALIVMGMGVGVHDGWVYVSSCCSKSYYGTNDYLFCQLDSLDFFYHSWLNLQETASEDALNGNPCCWEIWTSIVIGQLFHTP